MEEIKRVTTRRKEIIERLCREDDYVTINSISKDIGVSTRTILRELKEIEGWLEEKGYSLSKKTGVGIKLSSSLKDKELLLMSIDEEASDKTFTPEERQTVIISELLQNKEPIKLYHLTRILYVSEGTISNDLDKLEGWLSNYSLRLIRKPGLGVYLQGNEKNKRRAMVNLIYEKVDEKQILNFIQENIGKSNEAAGSIEINTRNRLLNLMEKETIRKLEELINKAEENMNYKLADSSYVGLIVHLALAIKRIKNNEKIIMDKGFLADLKENSEFEIAKNLAENIATLFNIEIREDEIGYITMHLMGSKNRSNTYVNKESTIGYYQIVKLAKEIIRTAEAEMGSFIEDNEKLLIGLVNHLEPAIKRLKMRMDIRNPLLQEIKDYYPHLIRVSEKCVRGLEEYIGDKVPESEIAYIAMHLGAAFEKKLVLPKRKFRVAVACPSGIGTSSLLATRIEKEYDSIQVVDLISAIYVMDNWLKEEEIDFVISTISMENINIPAITVNPLLMEDDINRINSFIEGFKRHGRFKEITQEPVDFKERLLKLQEYSEGILQILDSFFLYPVAAANIQELIDKAAILIDDSKDMQQHIRRDLLARERKGGTLISGKGILLLHCRTTAVDTLYFGALNLTGGLTVKNGRDEGEEATLALVMLAPEDSKAGYYEVISEVSKMIIDRPMLLNLFKEGEREKAYIEISNYLTEFYKFKINN